MKRHIALWACIALGGCMVNSEGVRLGSPPPAVQGSNDVQGSPLMVPGTGVGIGAGNPSAPGVNGAGAPPASSGGPSDGRAE